MRPISLITGITGQDGSILSRLLLGKGHKVHGIIRRSSSFNTNRIDDLIESKIYDQDFFLHYGDLTDSGNLDRLISEIKPQYLFNLGAMSHVKVSFEVPEYTAQVDGIGVLRVLDAIYKYYPECRFYQASTSELYGGIPSEMPSNGYDETSDFHPRSPYGAAKLYGYWITKNYREAYNLFASNGILFNHTSFYRGPTFVSKKIVSWCAQWYKNNQIQPLQLGNLNAKRDFGHALDFCRAMILIMEHDRPDDWVIATGETHTIKEFVNSCFDWMNKKIEWTGTGLDEKGICDGKIVVEINERYFRPSEVELLLGNSTKARTILGWKPQYDFISLVDDMMSNEIKNQRG